MSRLSIQVDLTNLTFIVVTPSEEVGGVGKFLLVGRRAADSGPDSVQEAQVDPVGCGRGF